LHQQGGIKLKIQAVIEPIAHTRATKSQALNISKAILQAQWIAYYPDKLCPR
jgi:hypothetical protein